MLSGTESIQTRPPLWRSLGAPLARIILPMVFVVLGVAAAQLILGFIGRYLAAPFASILSILVALLAVYAAYRLSVQWIEKRPVSELSARGAAGELALGMLTGLGLVAASIGVLWALGSYQVVGTNPWLVLLPAAVANIPSGFVQEILFRGILFRVVEESLGTWLALAISALLFGLVHLFSANTTILGALAIMLEAGILLAAAYIMTGRLWLAIGIHIAWDFTLDGIFGLGTSGTSGEPIQGLLQARFNGPSLLTGGALGVEGSIVSVAIVLAAAILVLRRAHRKGRFRSPIKERN